MEPSLVDSNKEKIMVGMSGGVDSSVAAYLLMQQGYQVEGLFMKNWDEDDSEEYCSASVDLADAQQVCDKLEIPLHTVNFSSEYWDNVFEYFLSEYRSGRTPNPDIMCNKEIKFKAFLEHAIRLGASRIATGHYVRNLIDNKSVKLLRGIDTAKDQSYFLYALDQKQLSQALFPVGELIKSKVRSIAEQQGFVVHDKKDSTGICFIGERKFKDFLQRFIPAQPGDIVTSVGKTIGKHAGLMYYTIGQRQGLGIGGLDGSSDEPWYVIEKRLEHNQLIVAQGHDHPDLFFHSCRITDLHWIEPPMPAIPYKCTAKIRYRQADASCHILEVAENKATVQFDQPQRAITPGQALVLYQGNQCLGGGSIESAFNPT
ncbi:MAG: tRNA-specific 2-thiouridylase [Gammaproteobacteria bacterium]|jgi:tRNA-specific 2-thiouridylase